MKEQVKISTHSITLSGAQVHRVPKYQCLGSRQLEFWVRVLAQQNLTFQLVLGDCYP